MNNPLQSDGSRGLGLLLARLPLGIVLLLAGYMKFHASGGLARFVDDHLSQVPAYMPSGFGNVYLHAVPFAEMGLGALLIAGLLTRFSGFLTALMLISFGMIQAGAHGFVDVHPEMAPQLFQAPTTYALLALIAFFAGPGMFSVDRLMFKNKK